MSSSTPNPIGFPANIKDLGQLSKLLVLTRDEKYRSGFLDSATPEYDVIVARSVTKRAKALMKRSFVIELAKIATSSSEFVSLVDRLNLDSALRQGAFAYLSGATSTSLGSAPMEGFSDDSNQSVEVLSDGPCFMDPSFTFLRGLKRAGSDLALPGTSAGSQKKLSPSAVGSPAALPIDIASTAALPPVAVSGPKASVPLPVAETPSAPPSEWTPVLNRRQKAQKNKQAQRAKAKEAKKPILSRKEQATRLSAVHAIIRQRPAGERPISIADAEKILDSRKVDAIPPKDRVLDLRERHARGRGPVQADMPDGPARRRKPAVQTGSAHRSVGLDTGRALKTYAQALAQPRRVNPQCIGNPPGPQLGSATRSTGVRERNIRDHRFHRLTQLLTKIVDSMWLSC